MRHRHLNHSPLTLAAIDDIIARGQWRNWADLRTRFDEVLQQLESVAGWRTARLARPVQIPGSLDGIQTGVRQLIRTEPLETTTLDLEGAALTIPTQAEILRIKGVLILKRNATRDYLDFVALATRMGPGSTGEALRSFDRLYPQKSGESALQQLQAQLANPLPYDLARISHTGKRRPQKAGLRL